MPDRDNTLWAYGMPTPGQKQRWFLAGGSYYVDVTDQYVPAPTSSSAEDEPMTKNERALLDRFVQATLPELSNMPLSDVLRVLQLLAEDCLDREPCA